LHRNPLVALASTTYRSWTVTRDLDTTIRAGTLPAEGPSLDLSSLRGRAAGKNVVWVLLESTGARYTGLYGGIPDPTPRLTAFAEKSVVFDSVHCAIPDSIRGLFSMLCSVVPRPYVSLAAYAAERAPCESIAGTLAAAGYRTGFFHSGRFRYIGMKAIVEGRGFHVLRDAESIAAEHESSFGIDDASTARSVLAFVDSVAGGPKAPFFAVYSPIAGHHPYRSPGPGHGQLPGNDERELYLNDLTTGDVAFGILVDGIRSRGLLENTLFVIVGDHGQAFDQHPGNFGHTLFVYEENTHVPFVVVAPGLLTEKLRAPQIGSLVDMAPTTLALLGIDASASHHGRSLLRPAPGSALFMTDHDLLKAGLRHSHYKLLYESEHERFRLFDLQSDPGEQTDIARSQPARVALYERHLVEWLGLR
jgi:phosphoglycerol transferase MdoB-like AlkP superfamily enzyme